VEEVEKLLQKGMDINSVDEKGWTPLLHLALPKKNEGDNLVEIVRLLITKGANVHCETENKMNALHLLCEHYKNENFIDLVKLLIEKGIKVNRPFSQCGKSGFYNPATPQSAIFVLINFSPCKFP
jgi:ankyrin repeat protein